VAVADALLPLARSSRLAVGVLDEAAHLATGLVALRALASADDPFARGVIAGSVVIDVDHVPGMLGSMWLHKPGKRPYPHSLATPAAVTMLARATNGRARRFLVGLAAGTALHLLRDAASGQGAMLLWPFSGRNVRLAYPAYAGLLLVMTAAASRPGGGGSRESTGAFV
jgi:inner membrane protein